MPRTAERGGPQTRARIREASNALFIERGFDAVTVAEVARAAGVSSVTVFNHFPTKEDLFLDRADDATELLRSVVRDHEAHGDVVAALRNATVELFEQRHPLSGVAPLSFGFYRTVAGAPSLVARAREIAAGLQRVLAEELERDDSFSGDAGLLAAFFIGGYSAQMVRTAGRLIAGDDYETVVEDHRVGLNSMFDALNKGFAN